MGVRLHNQTLPQASMHSVGASGPEQSWWKLSGCWALVEICLHFASFCPFNHQNAPILCAVENANAGL